MAARLTFSRIAGMLAVLALALVQAPRAHGEDGGNLRKAILAAGCFWCMQPPFDHVKGVVSTRVGYTGGKLQNPSYEQVSSGTTGYRECIEVTYDPAKISFEQLLDIFWRRIDPTQGNGQFGDVSRQYRTAIYYSSEEEKKLAEASRERLQKSGKFSKPIATEILPAEKFWPAEEHHQKYYLKNPEHFEAYERGSGRVDFFKRTWGE